MFNMKAPWILCLFLLLVLFIKVSADGMHISFCSVFVFSDIVKVPFKILLSH